MTDFTRYFILEDKNAYLHVNDDNIFLLDISLILKPKYDCDEYKHILTSWTCNILLSLSFCIQTNKQKQMYRIFLHLKTSLYQLLISGLILKYQLTSYRPKDDQFKWQQEQEGSMQTLRNHSDVKQFFLQRVNYRFN